MKQLIFAVSGILSIIILIQIIKIIVVDYARLTQYGFGYLIGLIILFVALSLITFFTGKLIFKKSP